MNNQYTDKSSALKNVFVMELKIVSRAIFAIYLLLLVIKFFTYNGRCSELILGTGPLACSYLYAVFVEPIVALLVFAILLWWIWISLFVIITIALTAISSKKLN